MLIQKDLVEIKNAIIVCEPKSWVANSLYKLVVQNEKIYGIWIGGQINYLNYEFALNYFGMFLSSFIPLLFFANYNNLFNSILSIFGFILTLIFLEYLQTLIIKTDFWQNLVSRSKQKSRELSNQSYQFIDQSENEQNKNNEEKDKKFLNQNRKNFILPKSEIAQIEITSKYDNSMYPEKHFGQIIIKNPNKPSKRKFLPKEISSPQTIFDIFSSNGFDNLIIK